MYKSISEQVKALIEFDGIKQDSESVDFSQESKLLKALSKLKLFTEAKSSAKLAKNLKFKSVTSYILYMSPADLAYKALGRLGTLCPFASAGCKAVCLNTAGRGRFDSVSQARLRKALYYIVYKDYFMQHLFLEVSKLRRKVKRGVKLVIRLNGTTDINYLGYKINGLNIFETFQDVQFYDYTKNLSYALKSKFYPNYHITFSGSESNHKNVAQALDAGINVAQVFKVLPLDYNGIKVINGDEHDLRFLDEGQGIIIGLTAKGKAKKDTSGFVITAPCQRPKVISSASIRLLNFLNGKSLTNKGA